MQLKKTITVPVRLDEAADQRIKRAARRMKTSAAAVIRLAIAAHLTAIESGSLRLPSEQEAGALNFPQKKAPGVNRGQN